ncbi:MAG TPA: hypothetical protein DER10_11895 [Elusimicrobia bacterium]|nr:hypothetical protein [Elusimicrobiota bacterium]
MLFFFRHKLTLYTTVISIQYSVTGYWLLVTGYWLLVTGYRFCILRFFGPCFGRSSSKAEARAR